MKVFGREVIVWGQDLTADRLGLKVGDRPVMNARGMERFQGRVSVDISSSAYNDRIPNRFKIPPERASVLSDIELNHLSIFEGLGCRVEVLALEDREYTVIPVGASHLEGRERDIFTLGGIVDKYDDIFMRRNPFQSVAALVLVGRKR